MRNAARRRPGDVVHKGKVGKSWSMSPILLARRSGCGWIEAEISDDCDHHKLPASSQRLAASPVAEWTDRGGGCCIRSALTISDSSSSPLLSDKSTLGDALKP